MELFITGATGFIGTHLVQRLMQEDHELHCLVRKTSDVRVLEQARATLITGDVTDKGSMIEGMKDCDRVLHLANVYEWWLPDKQVYTKVNVDGTRNVMECALETEVPKVVHVSRPVVYGKPADCPFTEESPVGPVRFSQYAQTKYEGDLIAWEFYEQKGQSAGHGTARRRAGPGRPQVHWPVHPESDPPPEAGQSVSRFRPHLGTRKGRGRSHCQSLRKGSQHRREIPGGQVQTVASRVKRDGQ